MDSSPPAAVGRAPDIDALVPREDTAAARRSAAWSGLAAGAVPSALSLLAVLALTPTYMRVLSQSLYHLLPLQLAAVAESAVALGWFALPACGMLLFVPWIRTRVRQVGADGRDLAEASAAGVSMGAVLGSGAALGVLALETTRAVVLGPVALSAALGAGVLSATAFASSGGRGRHGGPPRPLPPAPTALLAAGLGAPALAAWGLAGAWLLELLLGVRHPLSSLVGSLPWVLQPLAEAGVLMALCLPATFLLGRVLRRLLPTSPRRAAALGVSLIPLVPLLHASRPLLQDIWYLPLAPFLMAFAALLGMGSHATALFLAMGRPEVHDPEHSLPGSTAWRDPR